MTTLPIAPVGPRSDKRGNSIPLGRVLLLALGGLSLLAGLDAGLVRLGVWAPVTSERVGDLHGPVMVLGFLGTLISLVLPVSIAMLIGWFLLFIGWYLLGLPLGPQDL